MKQTMVEIRDGEIHAEVEYRAFWKNPKGQRIAGPEVRIKVLKGEWVTIDKDLLTYEPEWYGEEND